MVRLVQMLSVADVRFVRWKLFLGILVVGTASLSARDEPFKQRFRVTPQTAELEVSSHAGSIRVVGGEGNSIRIKAAEKDDKVQIDASETKPSHIKVDVRKSGKVKLEIAVPTATSLDLFCYKCEIEVRNVSGTIIAKSTEGDIEVLGGRSARVEAHTTTGDVLFDGEIMASGSYTLKSLSGAVSVKLPRSPDIRLSATSFRGGIGLGDFKWNFAKQTDKFVEATHGKGLAALNLLTKEGTIQILRRE